MPVPELYKVTDREAGWRMTVYQHHIVEYSDSLRHDLESSRHLLQGCPMANICLAKCGFMQANVSHVEYQVARRDVNPPDP